MVRTRIRAEEVKNSQIGVLKLIEQTSIRYYVSLSFDKITSPKKINRPINWYNYSKIHESSIFEEIPSRAMASGDGPVILPPQAYFLI